MRFRQCLLIAARFLTRTVPSIIAIVAVYFAWHYRAGLSAAHRTIERQLATRGWQLLFLEDREPWLQRKANRLFRVSRVSIATIGNDNVPTNDDLEALSPLTSLRSVCIVSWKSDVDDMGVSAFARLPRLEILFLRNSRVTDRAIRELAECRVLNTLVIDGTRITDASIEYLPRYRALRQLIIYDSHLSLDEQKRLRAAIPKCDVTFSDSRNPASVTIRHQPFLEQKNMP